MSTLNLDERGIVIACSHCGQKNRLALDKLSHAARCGQCREPVTAGDAPLEVRSSADFDLLVGHADVPVLVDFWASWCGPCLMVAPELEKVAARSRGRFLVVKVDTDALTELAQRFGIRSIPTMAVFIGGREITRSSGVRPAAEIERLVDNASTATRS